MKIQLTAGGAKGEGLFNAVLPGIFLSFAESTDRRATGFHVALGWWRWYVGVRVMWMRSA